MRLWRISGYADLSGRGGTVSAGRWNFRDTPIVYCADHPATALLEMLVHIDAEDMPADYQLLEIDAPDTTAIFVPDLPPDWKENTALTRQLGTGFIASGSHAMMEVPCAIVPFTRNYLINPALTENAGIRIVGVTLHPVDTRLLS